MFFVKGIESWKGVLQMNVGMKLGFEEDLEDEFDNKLSLKIVDVVNSKFLDKSLSTPSLCLGLQLIKSLSFMIKRLL